MRRLGWLLLPCALLACRDKAADPIRIVAGPSPSDQLTLVPRASLAEYIEISPSESALLLTLSSVERSCEGETAPPVPDSVTLAVRVHLPGGSKLAAGSYPILAAGQPPDRPSALPTVKLRGRRQELQPGGELQLREVNLSPRGSLSGLMKFDFPGDATHAATRVSGRFTAHFCSVNRLR